LLLIIISNKSGQQNDVNKTKTPFMKLTAAIASTKWTRSLLITRGRSKITLVVSIVSLPEALLFKSFKARPQPFCSLVVSSQFHVEESYPSLA
jgi:hypothetical protein